MSRRNGGTPFRPDSIVITGRQQAGQIPRELLRDPSVSAQAKTLWTLLEDHSSPDSPRPFPGKETLGGMLGVTERTITTWSQELGSGGWRTIQRGGRGRSNRYVLHWDGRGLDRKYTAAVATVGEGPFDRKYTSAEVDLAVDQVARGSKRSVAGPEKAKKEKGAGAAPRRPPSPRRNARVARAPVYNPSELFADAEELEDQP